MTQYKKETGLFALARNNDPVTSHLAADAMNKGKVSKQGSDILWVLKKWDGSTAGEIDAVMKVHAVAHKRMAELERRVLIARGEARKCRVSGTKRLTWWLTEFA